MDLFSLIKRGQNPAVLPMYVHSFGLDSGAANALLVSKKPGFPFYSSHEQNRSQLQNLHSECLSKRRTWKLRKQFGSSFSDGKIFFLPKK